MSCQLKNIYNWPFYKVINNMPVTEHFSIMLKTKIAKLKKNHISLGELFVVKMRLRTLYLKTFGNMKHPTEFDLSQCSLERNHAKVPFIRKA